MTGNGTATVVGGSSDTWILSTPFTEEAVDWEQSGGLVELPKVITAESMSHK